MTSLSSTSDIPTHDYLAGRKLLSMIKSAKTLGERLKALRRARRGMSADDAAEAIGISRSTLSSIENGHDLPGRDTLFAIANFYNVSTEFLITGSGPAPGHTDRGEVVYDPDELALLRYWRSLSDSERFNALMTLLRTDSDTEAA